MHNTLSVYIPPPLYGTPLKALLSFFTFDVFSFVFIRNGSFSWDTAVQICFKDSGNYY